MLCRTVLAALSAFGGVVYAMPQFSNTGPSTGGSGPYTADYSTTDALPRHTLYYPKEIPEGLRLPVLIWGEGGCAADGLQFLGFLNEVASHGFFIVASGAPNGSGQTTSEWMTEAIDWVTSDEAKAAHPYIESSRIAAAGQSCGGVEAYDMVPDERVSSIGIFNSGLMQPARSEAVAPTVKKPIFYFIGGSADIAYANAERDWALLPADTPRWKGNLAVGHGGTYRELDGGAFGVAGTRFLQWTLRGDTEAAEFFTGGEAETAGWVVESGSLDKIDVEPLE